ncbi:MAG: DUF362 domain-containing protein [Planctomycetes bacterium]|nr:DUF362 domain-containing protein [Planctomycetota bacterium]
MQAKPLGPSPFNDDPSAPRVVVTHGEDAYHNALKALSAFDLSPAKGKRVLLKPNVGRNADPGAGVTTNPEVVAAAIDAFRAAGAEVAIGESPISGVNTMEAFEITGIAGMARERDCPLIDMDERPALALAVPDGIAINSLRLCPELMEFDIVVSIPVMKMHMHTGVTLAIKNMKGCLWRRSKVTLHMLPPVEGSDVKPINIAIADMSGVLRPHFSLIDGSTGMEGLGPSAGVPKKLNCVVAGVDAFAADAVACRLMGTSAGAIPHLSLGAERGYGIIDLGRIKAEPENWMEWADPFETPPENIAIDFPNVVVHDKNSCSACQSTLLLFLKRYSDKIFDYFPSDSEVHFAIGKGHEELPEGTVCIGNCTSRHRGCGVFIPGCPPVGSEILTAISGMQSTDVLDAHRESKCDPDKDKQGGQSQI